MPPLLVSFLFALDTELGHLFEYNKTVGDAARLLGWEHIAAVRAAAKVSHVPPGWSFCLGKPQTRFRRKPLRQIEILWRLFTSLIRFLRHLPIGQRPVILFLEWFDLVHVIPFVVALHTLPIKKRPEIWVLYRLEYTNWQMRLMHNLFRLSASQLTVLSDSELVARCLQPVVRRPIHIMPIPHTSDGTSGLVDVPEWAAASERERFITCWMPGAPMPAKGSELVRKLLREEGASARRLCIIAAENAQFRSTTGGCRVINLPQVLTRAQYIGWLHTADVALLPYDPRYYGFRTSGIFVEAVSAGVIPLITDGTWTASELRQYDLEELILDWSAPPLADRIVALTQSAEVHSKLARMQAVYRQHHSLSGYARALENVWQSTMSERLQHTSARTATS